MASDRGQIRSADQVRTLLLAILVGALGGLGAVGFRELADFVQEVAVGPGNLLDAAKALPWWARLLVPTVGATVAAILLARLGRESHPVGVADVMQSVSLRTGSQAHPGPVAVRAVASLGVISTGSSVGREGPILQISAALAAWTGRMLGLSGQRLGLLLGCGVAAGMAAAYNAPVAGALFALELVVANFAIDVFAPVVLASVSATAVWRAFLGDSPIYAIPEHVAAKFLPYEALGFLLLGTLAGLTACAFLRALQSGERLFARLPGPAALRLPLGGLAIGALGLVLPEVWGNGFNVVDRLFHGEFAVGFVALLLLAKLVATAISVGSGAPGGVFTPSLFLGACLGLLLGAASRALVPSLTGPLEAYEMVGMAGLLAGTTRAPIMAVFVLVEMTGDFEMVIPLLLGAVAATVVARRLMPDSVYTGKLRRKGVHLPEGLEELALTSTRVQDVMRTDQVAVAPGTPFDELLPGLLAARRDALYVQDAQGRLLGAIHVHEIKQLLGERELGTALVAADLARDVATLTPEVSLAAALDEIDTPDLEEVPVVADARSRRLVGVVGRRDVLAALAVEVLGTPALRAKFVSRGEPTASYVELPPGHRLARLPLGAGMAGRSIGALDFRRRTSLSILSVVRAAPGAAARLLPDPDLVLQPGDELVVYGSGEAVEAYPHAAPPGPPP